MTGPTLLEERHLWQDARVGEDGICLRSTFYRVLIVEGTPDPRTRPALKLLEWAGRLIRFSSDMTEAELIKRLDESVPRDIRIAPSAPGLRVRHVVKDGRHGFMLFNETRPAAEIRIELPVGGPASVFDPWERYTPVKSQGHGVGDGQETT